MGNEVHGSMLAYPPRVQREAHEKLPKCRLQIETSVAEICISEGRQLGLSQSSRRTPYYICATTLQETRRILTNERFGILVASWRKQTSGASAFKAGRGTLGQKDPDFLTCSVRIGYAPAP